MLGVIELLGLLQNVGRVGAGNDGNAIIVGHDDVIRVDADPGAGDRHVGSGKAVMIDGGRGGHADAKHGKLQAANLRRIANSGVDDGASEATNLHGGGHQPADAGGVRAILEDHHVHGAGGRGVYGIQHPLRGGRAFMMLFLLEQNRHGRAGELGHKQRPHLVGHMGALPIELLDGVGDGRDFDGAETFDQRIAGKRLRARPPRHDEDRWHK